MMSTPEELTVEQAAEALGVPVAYLVGLLDNGEIAYTKADNHYAIEPCDVAAYKLKRDRVRRAALDELIAGDADFS